MSAELQAATVDSILERVPAGLTMQDRRAIAVELLRRGGAPDPLVVEGRCRGCVHNRVPEDQVDGTVLCSVGCEWAFVDGSCPGWEARP